MVGCWLDKILCKTFGVHILEPCAVFRDVEHIVPKGKYMADKRRNIEVDKSMNSMKKLDFKQSFDNSD